MNSERRKRLAKICEQLEEIQVEIQAIADEEQECYDNLPESLQYTERGERMSEIVDTLNDAANDMESITEKLWETQE
jgi:hypothetical protein